MTIPESVREALLNLKSIEDVNVARDAVLVRKWRETVCEWAVENLPGWTIEALSDSDDDEPVTEEWLRDNGFDVEPHHNFGWEARKVFIETPFHDEVLVIRPDESFLELSKDYWSSVIDCKTRGQVRKLLEALKGE